MRALVLAAGLGMRLRPLTSTTPKPLVEVAGRPLIHYALDVLAQAGIVEVGINLHHLGDQVRDALGDGHRLGFRFTYFPEDPILDTGGAIANARSFLDGAPFVVINSDTITGVGLAEMVATHEEHDAIATMLLRADPQADRYGIIEADGLGRIRRFLGRTAPGWRGDEALRPLMFGGIHVFSPRVFSYMEPGTFSITRETYPRMLDAGERLAAYVYDGFWCVLDTPDGLAAGRRAVLERMSK